MCEYSLRINCSAGADDTYTDGKPHVEMGKRKQDSDFPPDLPVLGRPFKSKAQGSSFLRMYVGGECVFSY